MSISAGPEQPEKITVVIPTLNEARALPTLVSALNQTLTENPDVRIDKLIVVDDGSTDGTLEFVHYLELNPPGYSVSLVARVGSRGCGSAEIEGIKRASTSWILKMDADGQHPVEAIPSMVRALRDDLDVVIASRYVLGGGTRWPATRGLISRLATLLAHTSLQESRPIHDPLSGFYLTRRSLAAGLNPQLSYYKGLLHLIAASNNIRFLEIPFVMSERRTGSSKIVGTSADYILHFVIELLRYIKLSSRLGAHRVAHGSPVFVAEKAD